MAFINGTKILSVDGVVYDSEYVNRLEKEVREAISYLYDNKANNDERFAVFTTDKPLTAKTGDNWLTFKQVKYGCGYGTDSTDNYDTLPKIGDLLICKTNGWLFKVAGVQKQKETICAWFIAAGTGDIDVADKTYVDNAIAQAKQEMLNYLEQYLK